MLPGAQDFDRELDFFRRDEVFLGTLAPFFLASDRPIAIACLRLFTLPPWPDFPRLSVPFFRRRIALSTDRPAPLLYFRLPRFAAIWPSAVVETTSSEYDGAGGSAALGAATQSGVPAHVAPSQLGPGAAPEGRPAYFAAMLLFQVSR